MFVYLVSINWNLALVFDTLPQVAQAKLAYVIQSQPRGKLTFLLYCVTFAILKMHLPHRNTRNHLQTSKLSFPKHFIKFWCISRPFQKFPIHSFISEGANLFWALLQCGMFNIPIPIIVPFVYFITNSITTPTAIHYHHRRLKVRLRALLILGQFASKFTLVAFQGVQPLIRTSNPRIYALLTVYNVLDGRNHMRNGV